jgi:diguanylate cyclase (GGDEF)-like protein
MLKSEEIFMATEFSDIDAEQLKRIIDILGDCTDTYLFIYNLTKNHFSITSKLVAEFKLPGSSFDDASTVLRNIICSEDTGRFNKEAEKILSGKTLDHTIEYRLLNNKNNIVWVSSRGRIINDETNGDRLLVGRVELIGQKTIGDNLTGLITDLQLVADFRNARSINGTVSGFLMKLDIDNLGVVNEQYGIAAGDNELKVLADCCRRIVEPDTKIYRSQSDEIIFMNLTGGTALDAQHMYADIKREISVEEEKSSYETMFTVSAGTIAFFEDQTTLELLQRKLDFTLQQAKKTGKNNNALFNATSFNHHLHDIELQELMRSSVKNGFEGFELHYQPVVNAKTKELIGAEALLRWNNSKTGKVVPDEFIPMLEQTGLIIPVGRWVLLTAFEQCAKWNKEMPLFHMSVNLSYIQIKRSDILTDVQVALQRAGVNPKNIALEITESGYVGGDGSLPELTAAFSAMGLEIDIDDFGTGYSNLRYLQYLHADTLKLDYIFTNKAVQNEYDRNVIKHITAMAHSINMKVCMEGVEFANEEKILSELGPDKYQGYFFGRPVNAVDFYDQHLHSFVKAKLKSSLS